MTKIKFDSLKRAIQDNLLDSFRGEYAPRPILKRLGGRPLVAAWLALAGAAVLLLTALCLAGFGSVASGLSIHPTWAVALYALLTVTCVIAVLNALGYHARAKALPFPAGVYLFPANLIDARERTIRVHPLADLSSVSAGRGGEVVLMFGQERFSFQLADPSHMQQAVQEVEAARDRMRAPLTDQERRQLDPLEPPAVVGPFTSGIPIARLAPLWERHRVLLSALLGCVVGAGLLLARNAMSDARMLAWAKARDDVASYESYLARGRRHRELVSQVLLPRAALRGAVAKGSVEAIDDHRRAYPATGIQAEVDAARRAALVAEFGRARGIGTLSALLSFAERYPEHGVGPALDEAKHALYMRTRDRYRQTIPEPLWGFVDRLVASAERAGVRKTSAGLRGLAVQVRFRRVPSKDIERADALVRQNPMFNGYLSLPSRYLAVERLTPHEQAAADAIASGLARAFDPEVATFAPGPRLDVTGDIPALPDPTLVMSYHVEPSGAAFALKKPQGIFLGLVFFITAEFFLPGDANPLRTKFVSTQRVPVSIIRQATSAAAPGALETAVYDEMVRGAFTALQGRYLAMYSKENAARP